MIQPKKNTPITARKNKKKTEKKTTSNLPTEKQKCLCFSSTFKDFTAERTSDGAAKPEKSITANLRLTKDKHQNITSDFLIPSNERHTLLTGLNNPDDLTGVSQRASPGSSWSTNSEIIGQ